MTDYVDVMRFEATSYIEGEPQMARTKVATVRCRIDDLRSRHTDATFRTAITNTQQNYGLIFTAADADVKVNDVLHSHAQNADWQIVEINSIQGAFGPHHLEIFGDKIDGSV